MTGRHYRFVLILLGLLTLAGCTAPDTGQPTLAALLPSPTPVSTPRLTLIPSPTAAPSSPPHSPTPTPSPWLLAYDSDVEGNDEIYLLPADGGPPLNLTRHPAEDRYPAWSPDGSRIAFQSNRDGNWEIYTLDLGDGVHGKLTRLTFDLAYDGAPTWSPDGAWIAFESYRDTAPCQLATPVPDPPPCPDLEIYRVPAEGGTPQRLTDSPQGDYQPAWSPDGDWIAFTSWRDGDKEIYVMPATGGPARNVTVSAGDESPALLAGASRSPTWSPDGTALVFLSEREGVTALYRQPLDGGPAVRLTVSELPQERPTELSDGSLLFARYDPGPAFEAHDPYRPGAYHLYRLPPGGGLPQPLSPAVKARHPAVAPLADLSAVATISAATEAQTPTCPAGSPPKLELKQMDDVAAPDPRLVAGVDEAFRAWRAAVYARSGHDYLGQLSDVFRPAKHYHHRLGYLSWHKAGRAVDLLFAWRDAGGKDALYIVREDLADQVYWRLFLKCAAQDGSMGEPLTQAPWYFWWHPDPAKEPETCANGGRQLPIPAGYFVDVTALGERYGWSRIASYQLEDFHWQRDSTATEYWHYQHTDGLTWYQAMAQIYPHELLGELFSRSAAAAREQTEEVMDGKGLPADTP
jgi:TolB protein